MTVIILAALSCILASAYVYITGFGVGKLILALAVSFLGTNVLLVLLVALSCLFLRVEPPISRQSRLCRFEAKMISRLLCGYFRARVHVSGLELLPEGECFLLVCNHRSGFDILVLLRALESFAMAFISKISNMELPVVGRIGYGLGCLAIDRENDRKALETVNMAADYLKREVCSMIIFPEGTRNRGEGLLPFRRGSFKIAKKSGSGVAVAAIRNTREIPHNVFNGGTDVYVDILRYITAGETAGMSTAALAALSEGLIGEKIKEEN